MSGWFTPCLLIRASKCSQCKDGWSSLKATASAWWEISARWNPSKFQIHPDRDQEGVHENFLPFPGAFFVLGNDVLVVQSWEFSWAEKRDLLRLLHRCIPIRGHLGQDDHSLLPKIGHPWLRAVCPFKHSVELWMGSDTIGSKAQDSSQDLRNANGRHT